MNTDKLSLIGKVKRDWQLLLLVFPGVVFYIIFRYVPMFGLLIAFQDYGIYLGITKSPWVGLANFNEFFSNSDFSMLFKNTFLLGIYNLIWSFPFPILFALLLNEVKNKSYKKLVQTISYIPAFLSVVVVCSMAVDMLSPNNGNINRLLVAFGQETQYFLIKPEWFRTIYITTGIWQMMGYSAVVYIAAIGGVDQQLYEAATLDGCGRLKSIWHVTIPGILPTVVTMFILNAGKVIQLGYEKVLLLYTPMTYQVADVFSTYVYRKGILESNFSYSTAVGVFEAVIALVIVLAVNFASKKTTENSLW